MSTQDDSTSPEVPPELAGVVHLFRDLPSPAARAAAAALLTSTMASVIALASPAIHHGPAERQPETPTSSLNFRQRKLLEAVQQHGPISTSELAGHVDYSEAHIKELCGPGSVLAKHGVRGTTRGYVVEKD